MKYIKPEMSIFVLDEEEIITTSNLDNIGIGGGTGNEGEDEIEFGNFN